VKTYWSGRGNRKQCGDKKYKMDDGQALKAFGNIAALPNVKIKSSAKIQNLGNECQFNRD